jgi:hypothetical protein
MHNHFQQWLWKLRMQSTMARTFLSCLLTKKIIEQICDTEIVWVNLLLYKYCLKQNDVL